jgi:hypothetical protein
MTEHKATPEQWTQVENWAHSPSFSCLLELRARVEALEAAAKPVESNAPASSDSLMEEVVDAITDASAAYGTADEPARAAILAVADWFEQQGSHTTAARLRQEV